MRILRNPDVNTETASSPASEGTTASSSTATPKSSESGAQTMLEAVKAAVQQNAESPTAPSDEEDSEASGSIIEPDQKEGDVAEASPEEETNEQSEEGTQPAEQGKKGPVPYERFQEVIREKTEALEWRKQNEPAVQAHQSVVDYCTQNNITPELFQQGMEVLAAMNTDPLKAREMLAPIWEQLSSVSGDTLPSDLQEQLNGIDQEVTDGLITETRAKQLRSQVKELAKLRGQLKVNGAKAQLSQQQIAQQQQQQLVNDIHRSLTSWDATKRSSDPDFAPGTVKYQWWIDNLSAVLVQKQPRTAAEAVRLAEQAYNTVHSHVTKTAPRKKSSPTISSTKSSGNGTAEPKSMAEAMYAAASRHGVRR